LLQIKYFSFLILLSLVLIGCQNTNLNLSGDVTSIDVYEWKSDELVATIDDKEFIDELVKELNGAVTSSTESLDFADPEYKLLFKNQEEIIYEIGYYKKVMNLGIEGQYWEFDKIYGVKLKLPID
jgi:tetrahydromethanopterin S-methyltransferase subunit B